MYYFRKQKVHKIKNPETKVTSVFRKDTIYDTFRFVTLLPKKYILSYIGIYSMGISLTYSFLSCVYYIILSNSNIVYSIDDSYQKYVTYGVIL